MSSEDNKKLCSKHNLEVLVIEFKQSNVDEGCIKCLMEKFDTQNIFLVQETKIMIHQMKSDILDKKVKQYLTMIETYQKIQSLIKELSLSITKILHKVEFNLSSKIQLIKDELKNSKQNIQVSSFEEDIKVLLKNQKGPFSFEVPSEFLIPINDNTYIESIQQQLQSIIKCPIFTKIIETLQKLKVKEDHLEINQVQQISNNQECPQNKQGLNIQCKKHGKDIIMLNLNPEKTELSRLVCVECISSNDPIKYTTLSDTNQQWNEYLEQTNDKVQQFQNKRCQNQTQIIKILEEIKEKHLSTIQDIMNKINIMFSTNQKNESKQINKNSIYDMNSEQLNGLAKILSNKDKFYDLTEKKYNIQKENYNQLEIISTSFGKLQKKRLKATNKINNIFKEQIINIIEDQVLNEEEDEISNLQSIKQLDLQLKILKIFQDILQEAQIQYESVMQKINILSNQFKNQQLQKFNEYISQFEKDFSIIKKLTCFDQIEAELNLLKENKKIRLIKPTEKEKIILQQQQKIIDFNKHQEEQRLKILDLKNEKEALKAKLKQHEQSKIKIEVNHEEKQEGYERCSQPNQNNEEIVKQLQETLVCEIYI
ncbi:unnamed protein product [Paramecium primaurelia]|uniref:Uncharacterized protein n=1 Tax=Paramecium primaurelia TaxID=5886 RepID=A0A8S1Q3Y7_PARPR|nr:unnamed protein product [Paramecium primaurelia]